MVKYDVIILGAGPAGLFSAHRLLGYGLSIAVIDRGKKVRERVCSEAKLGVCTNCKFCDLMYGVGGAGLFSDGKLNLNPRVGGHFIEFAGTEKNAWEKIEYIDKVFLDHGVPKEVEPDKSRETEALVKKCATHGIKFIPLKQRHIGSDRLPKIIESIFNYLQEKGVKFYLKTEVKAIDVKKTKPEFKGVFLQNGAKLNANYIVLAPGRSGSRWLAEESKRIGIKIKYNPIDIGVRVEVPAVVMKDITNINWDPKFHMRSKTYDDFLRTFCTCPQGFVVEERYEKFVCVNGHSMFDKKSENTNFAFLTKISLTEPVEDTLKYGSSIAKLATTIGGGRALLQRLADLRRGQRSTESRLARTYIKPTLKSVTPGDISMALPQRIVTNILEGLDLLDKVVPGVASDSTLLYAPEVKFHAMRVLTKSSLESSINKIFVAGDGAGVSRGIVGAAFTGVVAAESILKDCGFLT
jgi:hypothetical protein